MSGVGDMFVMPEGALEFTVDGEEVALRPGQTVY
jgi:hypothetical protein